MLLVPLNNTFKNVPSYIKEQTTENGQRTNLSLVKQNQNCSMIGIRDWLSQHWTQMRMDQG